MRTPLPSFKTNACPFAHTHAVKKVALPAESAVLLTTGSGTVCSSTSCGQQGDRGGRVRVVAVGRCGRGCYVVACIQARQRRRVQQQGQALMGAVCSNPVGLPPCTSPADTRALRGRSKGRGSQALLPAGARGVAAKPCSLPPLSPLLPHLDHQVRVVQEALHIQPINVKRGQEGGDGGVIWGKYRPLRGVVEGACDVCVCALPSDWPGGSPVAGG